MSLQLIFILKAFVICTHDLGLHILSTLINNGHEKSALPSHVMFEECRRSMIATRHPAQQLSFLYSGSLHLHCCSSACATIGDANKGSTVQKLELSGLDCSILLLFQALIWIHCHIPIAGTLND
jgi:hypothetical protein